MSPGDDGTQGRDSTGGTGAPDDGRRHVVHHRPDGDWAALVDQLVAQQEAGWRVTAASVAGPGVELLRERGIPHVDLHASVRRRPTGRGMRAVLRLRRVLAELQPEVLHTHGPGLTGRLAGRWSRSTTVVVHTPDGLPGDEVVGGVRRLARHLRERLAVPLADLELVATRHELQQLAALGVRDGRARHVGHGIDLERFDPDRDDLPSREVLRDGLGLPRGCFVIGTAGRLVHGTGWPQLFAAFRDAASKRDDLRLAVVGEYTPGAPDALPPVLVERAMGDGVVLLGDRDDRHALMRAFDCFVLPSRRGAALQLAMEAAAMRLPVLAPTGERHREVVEHGRTGELYSPRKPEALAYMLVRAAVDERRLEALAAGARRKAESEFDQRQVVDRTLSAYEEALQGLPAGGVEGAPGDHVTSCGRAD